MMVMMATVLRTIIRIIMPNVLMNYARNGVITRNVARTSARLPEDIRTRIMVRDLSLVARYMTERVSSVTDYVLVLRDD